ncbi:MAG: amino acid adenylation domain-containing protein, partial [Chromatiales bacterium]
MTALELIARLRERGIRIAARDGELELDAPRGALDEELRAELVARKPELLRLLSWSRRSGRELPLVPVTRDSQLPLSWAQQRLWFLDQLEPNSSAYNISWTVRLKGELRVDLLQAAVTQLVQRHESLRTVFPDSNGEPQQLVLPALDINLRQDEHILLVVIHHIVADGASMRVLFRELAAFYESALEGRAAELPDLPVQYADYAVWQRKWLDGEEMQRQTDYWLNVLQGLPPLLELPWDRPRSAAMRYRGASVLRVLPAGLAEELRALGRQQGCTLFMMMLAAFYVLLKRYAGRDDLAVGTPMGGRPRTDLEGLIGFFINTVVLRADLEGDPTFDELLHQVREIALGAHANQELPFEKLVEELHPQRELSYSPVFQVMFDLQEEPRWRLPVNNLEVIPEVVFSSRTSSFDLTLSVRQAESGLDAMFEYDTDLFDESSIEQLATHYQNLLEDIVTNSARPVSRLSLISAVERERIVNAWSSPVEVDLHAPSLQARFAARVMARPGAVALVVGADQYTYAELDDGANKLAQRLLDAGVRSGQVVALLAERSPQSIVGMLGILKAGGCVMPLDPDYPDSRVDFMLRDSQARVLLVSTAQARRAESIAADAERLLLDGDFSAAGQSDSESPLTAGAPDDIAFLLYTSGTTGTPKGVPLLQRGLVNYINQLSRKTGLGAEDRVLQFASLSFDISIEEIFAALLNGATLVLRDQDMNLSADQFLAGCRRFAISWASVPTAWWHELAASMALNRIALPEALRVLVIGGEKARIEAFRQWQKHAGTTRLFNTYGPTETSIAATWCELTHLDAEQGGELPIGSPVPNVSVWVVDEHMQPLPAGVPGELCIGGVGVAGGYWNRPDLSAGRFVADPFSRDEEARLYRTGDRARYRADGRLEFLGRMDAQIKIRGHRIEPGEIESAVAAVAGVEQAVVLPRKAGEEPATELRLVAYFTGSADTAEVQRSLRADLPEYMVPAAFLRMDSLPLTVNGKLDQQRLPAPEWSRDKTQAFVAPRTANEAIVARIWAEVLGLDRIGVHDDFFLSGGHSLLATRVVARLRDAFGAAIPLRDLFEAPTVAGLAETLASADAGSDSAPLTQAHRPSDGLLPLSWAQQRLWMLAQLDSDSSAYNLPWAARLSGAVDTMALQRAVDELVRRHESLRTAFRTHDGEPVQLVSNDVRVPVQFEELSGADAASVRERVQQLAAQRFELHSSPLIRVHLLTTGE